MIETNEESKANKLVEKLIIDSRYEITEDGKIFRIKQESKKEMKQAVYSKNHYLRIKYDQYPLQVHQIICRKFLGSLVGKTVNHKDGNKLNNKLDNLEIISGKENTEHAKRNGLLKSPYTENPPINNKFAAKIDFDIADSIRQDRKNGAKYSELISKYRLAKSTISYIVNNKTWRD